MVSTRNGAFAATIKYGSEQFRGGALAVGASDGRHLHAGEGRGKLHLASELGASVAELFRQRPIHIKTRAENGKLEVTRVDLQGLSFITEQNAKAIGLCCFNSAGKLDWISFVDESHLSTVFGCKACRSEAAAGGTKNGKMLAVERHGEIKEALALQDREGP